MNGIWYTIYLSICLSLLVSIYRSIYLPYSAPIYLSILVGSYILYIWLLIDLCPPTSFFKLRGVK